MKGAQAKRTTTQACFGCATRAQRPRRSMRAAALDPDNSSILVCGGAGVAMHTSRKLKDKGAWVWMLQRGEASRGEIEKMMAFLVKGDAMDPATLKKAMDGIEDLDAVVSTIGGTVADPKADGEGNINVINAAMEAGVKKFILVTSIGTGDSKDAPSEEVYNVLRPVLVEKEKAENALMEQSKMTWTIIRPGGLTNDAPTGKGFVTEDKSVIGSIAREDVATVVANALFSDKVDNKVVSCLDADRVTSTSSYEAIKL